MLSPALLMIYRVLCFPKIMNDLSIVYYTSNWLDDTNPFFLGNTRKQLREAKGDVPLIVVGQKSTDWARGNADMQILAPFQERSHLNIYRQILLGCKAATTRFVAMAEDDILYSPEHFKPHDYIKDMKDDIFYYDMSKLSLFTWTKVPLFTFRTKRRVVNHLIAPRKMLIEAMEERFARLEVLKAELRRDHPEIADPEHHLLKYWCDPGRFENLLGVTERKTEEFYTKNPSIVFSHPEAFGWLNQGKKKKMGDIRIVEMDYWGRAENVLKLWGDAPKV